MAEDEKEARPTMTAPSLLSGSTAARGEAESTRILAALEGRAPEAEVKHLAARRDPRARRWLALALLLALLAGGITWFIHEDPTGAMQAQAPGAAGLSADASQANRPASPAASGATPAATRAPQANATQEASDKPPAVAAIIDESPPARDADVGRGEPEPSREPTNPLSVLAMTPPATAAPAATAPGPTRQAAEQRAREAVVPHGNAPRAVKPAAAPRKAAQPSDTDAALLSALMNYGLPPASPPGTRVYKSDGIFMREMPGSPLSERLKECRKLSFFEGEQCRLRVCAGQWGTAAECPTPQANVEP
ncbi:hypothetical protein KYT87_03700 [Achromobacter sp. ES-001]|uniref:hypothetical protein n=1 Tax=Achromobacter sp. ES-001 TaxID=2860286 RepID=UPI001C6440FD|nr:hypothetical protein [Achromobacter sp. ES-001]QYJ22367.1 hypothetical protein KYT87_03700 [Achromobacter sp. ES-001]